MKHFCYIPSHQSDAKATQAMGQCQGTKRDTQMWVIGQNACMGVLPKPPLHPHTLSAHGTWSDSLQRASPVSWVPTFTRLTTPQDTLCPFTHPHSILNSSVLSQEDYHIFLDNTWPSHLTHSFNSHPRKYPFFNSIGFFLLSIKKFFITSHAKAKWVKSTKPQVKGYRSGHRI